MKTASLVLRLLDWNGIEIGRAEFLLDDIAPSNVNAQCRYRVEAFIERRDIIAQADAPFWDVRT